MKKIYLDNASTTPLAPKVKEHIIDILDKYGNPMSVHSLGMEARDIVEQSRNNVRQFISAKDTDTIVFTSSGSAANTLAIKGLDNNSIDQYIFLFSPTVHKSMKLACMSCVWEELKIDNNGVIDIDYLENAIKYIKHYVPVVCIDAANSEIGTIQDIYTISKVVKKYNGVLILDCTGYIPHIKLNFNALECDCICTFSGHKLHALKGSGVVCYTKGIQLSPLVYGAQENGLFAGTENVLGIAALGKAVEIYEYNSIVKDKRDYLLNKLIDIPNSILVGLKTIRTPNNIFICFKGVNGADLQTLLDLQDNIYVSTGSACNSGDLMHSSTLKAIGFPRKDINSCIRITLSGAETYDELDYVAKCISKQVQTLRVLNDNTP